MTAMKDIIPIAGTALTRYLAETVYYSNQDLRKLLHATKWKGRDSRI
jgi:hypothetical protein